MAVYGQLGMPYSLLSLCQDCTLLSCSRGCFESWPSLVVENCRSFFQLCPNLPALFRAQRRELKTKIRPEDTNNFRWDRLMVRLRQRNFEDDDLAQRERFSNETSEASFTEIARPAWQAKLLAIPLETNANCRLEHVTGGDPTRLAGFAVGKWSCHLSGISRCAIS